MKVILLCDVDNVGKENEIIEVVDGYAKNFLIRKGLAVSASEQNLHKLQEKLNQIKLEETQNEYELTLLKNELEAKSLTFYLKSNHDKTFGFVVNKQIIDEINKNKKIISKHMLKHPYKLTIGEHFIEIELSKKIIAKVKVIVNPK